MPVPVSRPMSVASRMFVSIMYMTQLITDVMLMGTTA